MNGVWSMEYVEEEREGGSRLDPEPVVIPIHL